MTVFTIGHSTRTLEIFIVLLRQAGVDTVADVRRFAVSRRHPQFNGKTLRDALATNGIDYLHMETLGGRREARADGKLSPHTLWRENSFRHYADYAETPPFHLAVDKLLKMEAVKTLAIMCAEADWKNCHRQIIVDYLLAAGMNVQHILDTKIEVAHLTKGAIIRADKSVLYTDTPLFANRQRPTDE